jgi:hypothetical protein
LINAKYLNQSVDNEFYNQIMEMHWDEVIIGGANRLGLRPGLQWPMLPYLLCGGGRSIGLYNDFLENINRANFSTSLRQHEIPMQQPEKLEARGLNELVFQRLTVAYGLSYPDIGTVITPEKIPTSSKRTVTDHLPYGEAYIEK